jgi:hypothetical protein
MTPFQVRATVEGVQKDRRRWSVHNAWHAIAYERQKRLKPLDTILDDGRAKAAATQSPDQMMGNLLSILGVKRQRPKAKQKADG